MKVEINIEQVEAVVIEYLKDVRNNFTDNTCGIPHVSYIKKEEREYCRKLVKSIDKVLQFLEV